MGRIMNKLRSLRKDPAQANMEYLLKQGLKIGANFSSFSPYAFDGGWPWLISVGDNVTFSTNVTVLAHDASPTKFGIPTKIGIVKIGDNVFVGTGAIILCNSRIGDNVIIGAGSVVRGDVPSNSVVAGNPAKVICTIDAFKEKHQRLREQRPYFTEYRWDQWRNASEAEKDAMRKALEDSFGYV
jgi:maltose O-acetyltransferase